MSVVPVSTTAWVLDMSCVDPYSTDLMSMPQYLLNGSDVIQILKTTGEEKYIPAEGRDSGQREVVERASVFSRVNPTKR